MLNMGYIKWNISIPCDIVMYMNNVMGRNVKDFENI